MYQALDPPDFSSEYLGTRLDVWRGIKFCNPKDDYTSCEEKKEVSSVTKVGFAYQIASMWLSFHQLPSTQAS